MGGGPRFPRELTGGSRKAARSSNGQSVAGASLLFSHLDRLCVCCITWRTRPKEPTQKSRAPKRGTTCPSQRTSPLTPSFSPLALSRASPSRGLLAPSRLDVMASTYGHSARLNAIPSRLRTITDQDGRGSFHSSEHATPDRDRLSTPRGPGRRRSGARGGSWRGQELAMLQVSCFFSLFSTRALECTQQQCLTDKQLITCTYSIQ